MNLLQDVISSDVFYRLGWVLLHSIWQFTLIAIAAKVVLEILRRKSAAARYVVGCAALSSMLVVTVVTYAFVDDASPDPATKVVDQRPSSAPAPIESKPMIEPTVTPAEIDVNLDVPPKIVNMAPHQDVSAEPYLPVETASSEEAFESEMPVLGAPSRTEGWTAIIRPWLPRTSAVWLCGVLLLSLWNLGGWLGVVRLGRVGVEPVEPELADRVTALANRMRLQQTVRALHSVLVRGPVVIGWWRPVLLLPAALLTGLSPQQLDALIAHELAHVRRYDYLVNLLQTIVETLLFYHPAVWWISRQTRVEREHCCDDAAVDVCGDVVEYAAATMGTRFHRKRSQEVLHGSWLVQEPLSVKLRRNFLRYSSGFLLCSRCS